jgi:hypothetical protein
VLPEQMSISAADEAFADDGTLKDAKQHERLKRLAAKLVDTVRRLNAEG